jgi:hypothetical protein
MRFDVIAYERLHRVISPFEHISVIHAWLQARMVAAALAPVMLGALVLRARHAAQRYVDA